MKKSVQRRFNFWDELHDNSYFDDNDRGIMGLETIKLTNNIYQISIPVNNTPIPVISYLILKSIKNIFL